MAATGRVAFASLLLSIECVLLSFVSLRLLDGIYATHVRHSNGLVQYLIHNGQEFFERIEKDSVKTAWTTEETRLLQEMGGGGREDPAGIAAAAVLFATPEAHLVTRVTLSSTFSISFKLKTVQKDGLVMYCGTVGHDFLAIELSGGHLRYIYDVGGIGPRLLRSNVRSPVNNNEWHDVAIYWRSLSEHLLRIDDVTLSDVLPHSNFFELHGDLYVGGVALNMYHSLPKKIRSKHGFQGCLSSLNLDGLNRDLLGYGISQINSDYQITIRRGCGGPYSECSDRSCENGGQCVQGVDTFTCYCDLTSFTGPTCGDDSIAYGFGEQGGTISFVFDDNVCLDTKLDSITFGITTLQSDAILLRISSMNQKDFLEIEMIGGCLFLEYNLGQRDHRIGELLHRINNDVYHVVNFLRSGANATIYLDNRLIYSYTASGRQLNIFNCQSEIFIGGLRDTNQQLIHPFHGTLVGLVINGLRLLDLAAEGDDRMAVVGDIDLDTKPLKIQRSSTAKPFLFRPLTNSWSARNSTTATGESSREIFQKGLPDVDDLIFTNNDPCPYDEEENCHGTKEMLSDSFILPVVKMLTKEPNPWTAALSSAMPLVSSASDDVSGDHPCVTDDEDCEAATDEMQHTLLRQDYTTATTTTTTTNNIQRPLYNAAKVSIPSSVFTTVFSRPSTLTNPPTNITSGGNRKISSPNFEQRTSPFPRHMTTTPTSRHPSNEIVIRVTAFSRLHLPETTLGNGITFHPRVVTRTTTTTTATETPPPPNRSGHPDGMSSFYPEFTPMTINIGLLSGVAVAVSVLLCTLVYVLRKCCRQELVVVQQQEEKNTEQKMASNERAAVSETNGLLRTSQDPPKRRDVKEWYV